MDKNEGILTLFENWRKDEEIASKTMVELAWHVKLWKEHMESLHIEPLERTLCEAIDCQHHCKDGETSWTSVKLIFFREQGMEDSGEKLNQEKSSFCKLNFIMIGICHDLGEQQVLQDMNGLFITNSDFDQGISKQRLQKEKMNQVVILELSARLQRQSEQMQKMACLLQSGGSRFSIGEENVIIKFWSCHQSQIWR